MTGAIMFNTEMAGAAYQGRKTQTRRLGRPRHKVGDKLWVREPWRTFISLEDVSPVNIWNPSWERGAGIQFEAGGGMYISNRGDAWEFGYSAESQDRAPFGKLRPGMFLCRHFSRMNATVTAVRQEGLRQISDQDALAEGCPPEFATPRLWYGELIDRINGKGTWAANPLVTVYTFEIERVENHELPRSGK